MRLFIVEDMIHSVAAHICSFMWVRV